MCANAQLSVAITSSHSIVSISKDKFGGLLYSKLQDVILVSGGSMRAKQPRSDFQIYPKIPLKMAQEVCTDVFTRIDTSLTDNHNKQRLST